ncbi:MAG: UbiA family prenyltransferase [Anaerolineae bacterium]|jgi:4-hydroxybenzoate polyprenyltransferase|nr:UbiA family prenyltransferase [Anaerolineae bacterium]
MAGMRGWLRWGFWLAFNHVDAWGVALNAALIAALLHPPLTWEAVGAALVISFAYLFGFAVNDYHDVRVDRDDPHKAARNPFVRRPISPRWALVGFVLGVAVLVLGLLPHGWRGVGIVALGVWALWAYSSPPLRLKARPGIDLAMHVAFVETFPYAAMLFLRAYDVTWPDVLLLVLFGLGSLASQLEQQARDYAFDKLHERNFTVRFGLRLNHAMMRLVAGAAVVMALTGVFTGGLPLMIVPYGLLILPLMLHRIVRRKTQGRTAAMSYVTLAAVTGYTVLLGMSASWLF